MPELEELPRVQALLVELLQLEDEDLQLPLPILMNLHRVHLNAPLDGLGTLIAADPVAKLQYAQLSELGNQALALLNERYPSLGDGRIFERCRKLTEMVQTHRRSREFSINLNELLARRLDGELRAQLIHVASRAWSPLEPLVLLHATTLSDVVPLAVLQELEIELGLSPEVRTMILEMAQVSRPVQSE
jgi:hypothetical protein